jgi:hypothetical protein
MSLWYAISETGLRLIGVNAFSELDATKKILCELHYPGRFGVKELWERNGKKVIPEPMIQMEAYEICDSSPFYVTESELLLAKGVIECEGCGRMLSPVVQAQE